jgi:predicted anti-sigma-YlaC factor YlaD
MRYNAGSPLLIDMSPNIVTRALVVALLAAPLSGCSFVKHRAINMVGNMLADSGSTFASDDDPELVAAAVPFGLKTYESLLADSPHHKGLLFAACSGFTQFSYAFVQQEADYVEAQDLQKATAMRVRAKKLYLRAVGYGMRDFDEEIPGFSAQILKDPDAALAKTTKKHVALLYYTGAAWAAAFAIDVTDSDLSIRQTAIEKMLRRALALDDTWELGSLHDFFISWEAGHASAGGSMDKAREHYARAMQISAGGRVSPMVSFAESVLVPEQKKAEFVKLLNEALAVDLSKTPPEQKLANVLAQRRATWLLSKVDELF